MATNYDIVGATHCENCGTNAVIDPIYKPFCTDWCEQEQALWADADARL